MAKQPTFIKMPLKPQPARNNVESTLRLHRALRKDITAAEKRLRDVERILGKLVRGEFTKADLKPFLIRQR